MKKIIYTLVFIAAIASLSSCTIEEIQQAEEAQSTIKTTETSVEADIQIVVESDIDTPISNPRR